MTRLQVSGYRFLVRRMEHALVRRDVRMLDDPLRAQSLAFTVGSVLAVLAVAGCGVLALLRPQGGLGSAPIVMVRDSGAIHVRIGEVWHPALNLASARLVTGIPADPEPVSASALAHTRRGAAVGIPGGPAAIGAPLRTADAAWSVCHGPTTAIRIGAPPTGEPLESDQALLVRSDRGAETYLLHRGGRARVDLRDTAVVRALRLDNVAAQPVSSVLLDAIPELPPITPPHIADAATPGPAPLSSVPVGTVVRLQRADAIEFYVVLGAGVQRVGEVAADLIRFTVGQPRREITTVRADVIAAVPVVDALPVADFPARADVVHRPAVCARWTPGAPPETVVLVSDSTTPAGSDVELASADGDGPAVDVVGVPAGRSVFVRATGLTGDGGVAGSLFLVTDAGVVFGVSDEQAANALGLTGDAVAAPWPLLARLPRGPELSAGAASVLRDSLAPS